MCMKMPQTLIKSFSQLLFSLYFFKAMQKNGQISSMSSLNGHSEDNTLAEGVCVCLSVMCCLFAVCRRNNGSMWVCCWGFSAVVSAAAEGKPVCVGSVFSVCVFVCVWLGVRLRSFARSLKPLNNHFLSTRVRHLHFTSSRYYFSFSFRS